MIFRMSINGISVIDKHFYIILVNLISFLYCSVSVYIVKSLKKLYITTKHSREKRDLRVPETAKTCIATSTPFSEVIEANAALKQDNVASEVRITKTAFSEL